MQSFLRPMSACQMENIMIIVALVAVFSLLLQKQLIFSLVAHYPPTPNEDQLANHQLKSNSSHLPPTNFGKLPPRESVQENLTSTESFSIPRIAFITFSYVMHHDTKRLFDFLLPAVDTWAAPDAAPKPSSSLSEQNVTTAFNNTYESKNVAHDESKDLPSLYVVFSHTSRTAFEHTCIHNDKLPPHTRKLCRRIHPIYVDCPEGKFGESPCCKQQKGLVEVFDKKYPLYDWYAFFDDDVYLRKEYIARLLAEFQAPDFPMAASPLNQQAKFIGHRLHTCGEGNSEFMYPWGQPIFYSRGAVKMMEKGYRANSLVSQCETFGITHDVGNQVLNWIYSLPIAKLPPLPSLPKRNGDDIGNHLVGRQDKELSFIMSKVNNTSGKRPDQIKAETIQSTPLGSWSFYETHKKWMDPKLKPPKVEMLKTGKNENQKWYKNVTGYRQTLTYDLHGDPQTWGEGQWFTMTHSDCSYPKYRPLWLGRDDGWMGGSYDDAVNFCSNIDGRNLCPFEAYCPGGARKPVMTNGFDTNVEHYSPVSNFHNAWVNVGKKNGDSESTCLGFDQLYPNQPEWGLTSAQPELKRYVLCCLVSR